MKFKSWKSELLHAKGSAARLERAAERDWYLGDLLVRVHVGGVSNTDDRVDIGINISTWRRQEGVTALDTKGNRMREGGYFEYESRPLDVLTTKQLFRVGLCLDVVERWVAGETDDLPDAAPEVAVVSVV